jgi:hypothetical protein
MPKIKTRDKKIIPKRVIIWPTYTPQQLEEFAKFLDKFVVEENFTHPKTKETKKIRYVNIEEAEVAYGAMRKRMFNGKPSYAIIVEPLKEDLENDGYVYPNKHELFMHKLDALQEKRSKKEYAEKKELESYQEMLEGAGIPKTFPET